MTTPTACHITGGAESIIEPVDGHLHHLPQRLIFWAHRLWNEDRVMSQCQLSVFISQFSGGGVTHPGLCVDGHCDPVHRHGHFSPLEVNAVVSEHVTVHNEPLFFI